jgi:hypothetical protein
MDMGIQHLQVNVAWTVDIEHGHGHAAWTWTCNPQIHEHTAWTMDMYDGMYMQHGRGHAA